MPLSPAERSKRLAYYHAGVGVVGAELSIDVHRLSVRSVGEVAPLPIIMKLDDWCFGRDGIPDFQAVAIEDYCTTLLGGSAGECLRAETSAGYAYSTMEQRSIERVHRVRAVQAYDALTDRAFGIVLAGLSTRDEADPTKTMRRLWLRAVKLLRKEPHRGRLDRLAARLLDVKELYGPEIRALIAD